MAEKVRLNLAVSPALRAQIDSISECRDQTMTTTITQAIRLLETALSEESEGNGLASIDEADNIVKRFILV
jgi:hypothetical protein